MIPICPQFYVADSDEEHAELTKTEQTLAMGALENMACPTLQAEATSADRPQPDACTASDQVEATDGCGSTACEETPTTKVVASRLGLDATPAPLSLAPRISAESPSAPRCREPTTELIAAPKAEVSLESPEQWRRPVEGYALRDLRRVLDTMFPRYGFLLRPEELRAVEAFQELPLSAQQLYARLLGRKWPQWIKVEGLGSRYSELGSDFELALAELSPEAVARRGAAEACDILDLDEAPETAAWLLDTASETAGTLLARQLNGRAARISTADNFGVLLLEALSAGELRSLAKGLGIVELGDKSRVLARLRERARSQKILQLGRQSGQSTESHLIAQTLKTARWICLAPSVGHEALSLLSDLFHLESCTADSSFVVFSTRWPYYAYDSTRATALFKNRACLDEYLVAHGIVRRLEQHERQSLSDAQLLADKAESSLVKAFEAEIEAGSRPRRTPFQQRFTAMWCWADALHHAVLHCPAVGDNEELRAAKIKRLRLLLAVCTSAGRRGRWYNELAKELARAEGPAAALEVVASGLAEGQGSPVTAKVSVDLTEPSTQESCAEVAAESAAVLPRDICWDLARRARALAGKLTGKTKSSTAWHRPIRETQAAQLKCLGTDDGGRWLASLVSKLLAEEAEAAGPVRQIAVASLGLPADSENGKAGRRTYDGFDLAELNVEELAMRHYFEQGFEAGIHCEGALLRDLFGIMLFDQLFRVQIPSVFVSPHQDAPLDLGTEAFYASRRVELEQRFAEINALSPSDLAAHVRERVSTLYGTRIRGVRWDRYEGPSGAFLQGVPAADAAAEAGETGGESCRRRTLWTRKGLELPEDHVDLGAAAGAIGGVALSAALRLLCEDFNASGLPDLLLWSWTEARARFVEVKSERDTLSRRQRLWLWTLRRAGAEAEVCHLRDGPVGRKRKLYDD